MTLLGVGRVLGMILIFASLLFFNSLKLGLVLIGLLYLLSPLFIRLKGIYRKN